jgi:hypothetical protein
VLGIQSDSILACPALRFLSAPLLLQLLVAGKLTPAADVYSFGIIRKRIFHSFVVGLFCIAC